MTTPTPFMPARYVAAPSPNPYPFGLLSVSIKPDVTSEDHWEAGLRWEATPCEPAAITGYGCVGGGAPALFGVPKTYRDGTDYIDGNPFVIYGSSKCSPIGGQWERGYDRATAHLLNGEERALERAIYLGEAGNHQTLIDPDTVDLTPTPGTAVSITAGVALLEAHLVGTHHSVGVIHANPRDVTFMVAEGGIIRMPTAQSTSLNTYLGTYVAAEGGMDGNTGPDGTEIDPADGTHWLYASGRPVVRRSQPFQVPTERTTGLDRATNDLELLVERTYIVAWECITAAVLVTTV